MPRGLVVTTESTDISSTRLETERISGTGVTTSGEGRLLTETPIGGHWRTPSRLPLTGKAETWYSSTPITMVPFKAALPKDLQTTLHLVSWAGLLSEALDVAVSGVVEVVRRIRNLPTPTRHASDTDPRPLVSWLRESAQFRMADIAEVLQVSRRTLYNWMEQRRVPQEHHLRLTHLRDGVRKLLEEWGATRIKTWLRSGSRPPAELLQAGDFGAFERAVEEALRVGQVPLLQARRVSWSYGQPTEAHGLQPLDEAARLQAFRALTTPRRPIQEVAWQPKELIDSDFEDEE